MSEEDVAHFSKSRIAAMKERKILKEMLLLYRKYRCLWDMRNENYGKKDARNEAFDVLLEKYRLIDRTATPVDIRKKIDNLRCTYKRQYKRVLLSKLNGWEYKPTLWYYPLLSFLDDMDDVEEPVHIVDDDDDDIIITEEQSNSNDTQIENRELVETDELETDESSSSEPKQAVDKYTFSNHEKNIQIALSDNETEAFGCSIGLQLKDLEPTQRYIAEKLISEVIFYGRLEKLNSETALSLNNTDEDC